MSLTNKTIKAPKSFKANSIIDFLNICQDIFSVTGKELAGFTLDATRVKTVSMIGVVLIYKVIEYTYKKKCFKYPKCYFSKEFREATLKYGFEELLYAYINDIKRTESYLKKLKISITDSIIIAPKALIKNDKYSSESLNKEYLPIIEKHYCDNPKGVKMIMQCFSEIFLNFWEHASDDTQSLIVADGNKQNIEIACVDNGKGIITSLGEDDKTGSTKLEKIQSSVRKGVTSKKMTDHMGYGLWIIDEITKLTNGRFHLYSEGCYYQREFGKVKSGTCGHWQGTIVYLSLPLINPITVSDIKGLLDNTKFDLKLNFI